MSDAAVAALLRPGFRPSKEAQQFALDGDLGRAQAVSILDFEIERAADNLAAELRLRWLRDYVVKR